MRRATPVRHSRVAGECAISIHALHEESDQQTIDDYGAFVEFQSTLSMRRATDRIMDSRDADRISIHALHEESDRENCRFAGLRDPISIHALHEESDLASSGFYIRLHEFQSTLSMRRATRTAKITRRFTPTFQSTLSMRRATMPTILRSMWPPNFNPRSP